MNKRQLDVEKAKLADEKKVLDALRKQYEQAAKDVQGKINIHTNKINIMLNEWDELDDVKQSIIQAQIYQRKFQQQLKAQLDDIIDKMDSNMFETVQDYLDKCYVTGFVGTAYDLHGQDIPIITPINQKAMLEAVTLDPKLSDKLYGDYMEDMKREIRGEISRGIATADSFANIARNISNKTNVGLNKTMRIVRTEGHRIQIDAAVEMQEKAKKAGADVLKQWDATLDGKTRDSHRMVDGELRELHERFSNGLMHPADPSGGAAEVVNCRCALLQRAKWALDDEELETLKQRAEKHWLYTKDPAGFLEKKEMDFDEFQKKYLKAGEKLEAGIEKNIQSGTINTQDDDIMKAGSSGKAALKTGDKPIKGQHSIDDDIGTFKNPVCNPRFSEGGDFRLNCAYTSVTYEMRRRGHDVIANPLHTMPVEDWEKLFIGASPTKYVHKRGEPIAEQLTQQLLEQHPNGSRGSLFVNWKTSRTGHFFSWEIEEGKVRFIDGQNGNRDASDYFENVKPNSIITIRWDDLELSEAAKKAYINRG